MRAYSICLFSLLLWLCGDGGKLPAKAQFEVQNQNQRVIKWLPRKQSEITELKLERDSLSLVSGSNFLFYPFGRIIDLGALAAEVRNGILDSSYHQSEDQSGRTLVYNVSSGPSSISFLKDERGRFQIVSGTILDATMTLKNKIRVGMTLKDFLRISFKDPLPRNAAIIKVVRIESVVAGIVHLYRFENGVLTSVRFVSDYLVKE